MVRQDSVILHRYSHRAVLDDTEFTMVLLDSVINGINGATGFTIRSWVSTTIARLMC